MERRFFRFTGFAVSGQTEGFFIHDFVRVDLPFDAAVSAFVHFVNHDVLAKLVTDAWLTEATELGRALGQLPADGEELPVVDTHIGEPRSRRDAVVLPIRWAVRVGTWIAPLDADLELVAFGPNRTHLHVLGRSQLPPGVPPCTDRASVEHRLSVAIVRHMLHSLAQLIVEEAKSSPSSRP